MELTRLGSSAALHFAHGLSSAVCQVCVIADGFFVWLVLQDAHGRWRLQISAGGLVSALMGVNNYSTLWIGWPGLWSVRGGGGGGQLGVAS